MESKRKILVRYRRGDGIRAISRELNISRNTVRDIIRSKGNIKWWMQVVNASYRWYCLS